MKDLFDFLAMLVMVVLVVLAMRGIDRLDRDKQPRYERRDCKTTIDQSPLHDTLAIEMTVCKLVTVAR